MLSGMRREVEDVTVLMQRIQSRLAVKEAARTSILSKSWLHAWSTIPTLRFPVVSGKKSMKMVDVDRTLTRYLHDNIPIEKFHLSMDLETQESASHAEKWIGAVATKSCLKEFSLSVFLEGASRFTLPDELLCGEKLNKIRFSASWGPDISVRMATSLHPVIRCVSLQQLHLDSVHIREEVLNDIFSSCALLEKVELTNIFSRTRKGFKTIKVRNLAHLHELSIDLDGCQSPALEISNVPNLGVFSYGVLHSGAGWVPLPFNADAHSMSLCNVTELKLRGVVPDKACLDMITTGCPFLESLTLDMTAWTLPSFNFTCASIRRLFLMSCPRIDVQVYAPKLFFFSFDGDDILPNLLFPVSTLRQLELSLTLDLRVDASFFLKMREVLTLSRKCVIHINNCNNSKRPLDIDINDLKKRLLSPPAINVHRLVFETEEDKCLWKRSPFFDAFFEVCHPKHVSACPDRRFRHNNHFSRLMLREVLDKKNTTVFWPHHLKHVQIRRFLHKKWKILTNSHRSLLQGSALVDFKLDWR